jgi:hypothetical protein
MQRWSKKGYGYNLTRQLFEDSLASLNTVENIITQDQIDCAFARTSHLLLANKPAHFDAMQREAEWYAQHFNHATHPIPKGDLTTEIGSQVYYGGLLDETSAGL